MNIRCKNCSRKLILEEIMERTAHYQIMDDGSYSKSPIEMQEDFIFEILCKNGCDDPGFEFDRYVGRVVEVES